MTQLTNVPKHVAIIMDGNGRWATAQGKKRVMGHRKGMDVAREMLEACGHAGVEVLTLFAFSSENWARPEEEVSYLMGLFIEGLTKEAKKLAKNDIKLKIIGDHSRFNPKLQQAIANTEKLTEHCQRAHLNIAANYGGRADIARAAKIIAQKVAAGELDPEQIDEQLVHQYTYLAELPAPDLMIRTGGEQRISNFLLWQMAYTELYFVDTLWPDFNTEALYQAFEHYAQRQRRFGKTGQQLEER